MESQTTRIDPRVFRVDRHWSEVAADHVLETFPQEKIYTCAAGISPSGVVHFGNFRDVITSYAVYKELLARGKKARFIFSWDEFDRFRKVPQGIDAEFLKYIGLPLVRVPDPTGEHESYAQAFEVEFERSMQELGIEMEYRHQATEYQSGKYDDAIILALQQRTRIGEILFDAMSEKGKEEKNITREEYLASYYPITVYSRFSGKDDTEILDFDGQSKITYKCLETGKTETIDIRTDHIVKLAWKADWPMRWVHEGVVFEPAGHDHASPGGSFDVSSQIAREIFGRSGPVFAEYKFVGLQGLASKMSGSKGIAVSPKKLLEIYEPGLLKWLYMRKAPDQSFSLAFDSEIYRQYDEFDREMEMWRKGEILRGRTKAMEISVGEPIQEPAIPFRQAVGFGQVVQWDADKLTEMLEKLEVSYSKTSIRERLQKARAWLETYNPDEMIKLRDEVNREYVGSMSEEAVGYVRALSELLEKDFSSVKELETEIYEIPKDPSLSQKENAVRQRAFFKDVYNLLISNDTGPRLSTFLWSVDRKKVANLLKI